MTDSTTPELWLSKKLMFPFSLVILFPIFCIIFNTSAASPHKQSRCTTPFSSSNHVGIIHHDSFPLIPTEISHNQDVRPLFDEAHRNCPCNQIITSIYNKESIHHFLLSNMDLVHCKIIYKDRPISLLHIVQTHQQAQELIDFGIDINYTTANGNEAIFTTFRRPYILLAILMNEASVNVFSSVLIPSKPHYVKMNPIDSIILCFLRQPTTSLLLSLMFAMIRNIPISFSNLSHFPSNDLTFFTIDDIKFLHQYISDLILFRNISYKSLNRNQKIRLRINFFLKRFSSLNDVENILEIFSFMLSGCEDLLEVGTIRNPDSNNDFIRKGIEKLVLDRHRFTTIV